MKLTINIASRKRPELLSAVIDSMLSNIEQPDTTLMVSLDDDDPESIAAAEKTDVLISVAPRPDTIADKWNSALTVAPADIYMPASDHCDIITRGFDTRILQGASLFPDGIGCVYFPTLNGAFPPFQALTARLVEKLGYIYPPYFPYWFVDHWTDDVCKMIDRIVVVDVEVKPRQAQTRGLRDVAFWSLFFEAGLSHRRELAHSIVMSDDFLDESWRKEMIKTRHTMIEAVSLTINTHTHRSAASIEANVGGLESDLDARYRRIRERAESMMRSVGAQEAA